MLLYGGLQLQFLLLQGGKHFPVRERGRETEREK